MEENRSEHDIAPPDAIDPAPGSTSENTVHTNEILSSLTIEKPSLRPKERSAEWIFFEDVGSWNMKSNNRHRLARCLFCGANKRSKRETLKTHIKACVRIPSATRNAYLDSTECYQPLKPSFPKQTDSMATIPNMLTYKLTKSQTLELEELVLRGAISTNSSFHALDNYDYQKVLSFLNPSTQLPTSDTFFCTVLERVHKKINKSLKAVYEKGCHVTISADGWKAGKQKKWLGLCRVVRSLQTDEVLVDLSDIKDVTDVGETEEVVESELSAEIDKMRGILAKDGKSSLVAVVTDSAACNVGAKIRLSEKYEDIFFLACFAHQLNLMAGNILTHTSTKSTVTHAKNVVSFFNTHPKHKAILQRYMVEKCGTSFEFVVEGDTRWYRHYGLVQSLIRGRESLNCYKHCVEVQDSLTSSEKCVNVLNILGNVTFWRNLKLISTLIRPITIDIGIIERTTANLSEVTQVFGRYWAYLKMLLTTEGTQFSCLPGLLEDLLQRWDWRLNLYYDVDLLVAAYVVDPRVGNTGLCRAEGHLKDIYGCLERVMEKRFKRFVGVDKSTSQLKRELKKEFIRWCRTSALEADGEEDPVKSWINSLEFGLGSPLRMMALELLSIVPHAADLERVWSTAALTLTSRRNRLTRATALKILQIKAQLNHEDKVRRTEKKRLKEEQYSERDRLKNLVGGGHIPAVTSTVEEAQAQASIDVAMFEGEEEVAFESTEDGAQCMSMEVSFEAMQLVIEEENLPQIASLFLNEEGGNTMDGLDMTDAAMDAFLSSNLAVVVHKDGHGNDASTSEPSSKRQKLTNMKKVTRKCEKIFDYSICLDNAHDVYGRKETE